MKKMSSFVWNHFTLTEQGDKAICHHCKQEFSATSTISNLGRHIKLRHPEALVADETSMGVYTVEELGQEQSTSELKSYEITVKGFEEMEDMSQSEPTQEDTEDLEWTPVVKARRKKQSGLTPASANKKQGKTKSIVWNHFERSSCKTSATCLHCGKVIRVGAIGTTNNLLRHLRQIHPAKEPLFQTHESASSQKPSHSVHRVTEEKSKENALENELNISSEVIEALVTNETPVEVYTVEEVGPEQTTGELETYEITLKSFEEIDMPPEAKEKQKNQPSSTSASSFKNNGRAKSVVWNHFERSSCKTSAICLHCGKVIRMGNIATISNLLRHLRKKHPTKESLTQTYESTSSQKSSNSVHRVTEVEGKENTLKNELDISSEFIELNVDSFQNPGNVIENKVNENENCYDKDLDMGIITQSSQTEMFNVTEYFDMHDYIKPKDTAFVKEKIDRQLVKMIVKGCHPVSMVEQKGFKEFVSLLNHKYELPSLNKLTKQLIPECYQECESRASKSLHEAEGICLYIDQWKSRTVTYMCITAHFINKECKFEPLFLACHVLNLNENSNDISQRLLGTVTGWDISDKVVAVVTDNTDIMMEAVKSHNWVHIPHFIKSLCLIVHESLQNIKSIIIRVKNITEELRKSPQIIAEIYLKHKNLGYHPVKLITKVKSDWNSSFTTLEMLSRFTKLKAALMDVLHHVPEYKLSENDWKILKSVVDDVLNIFKKVKQEVSKEERVCMSKIVFCIKSLRSAMNKVKEMNNLPSDAICVATKADTLLEKHFQDLIGSDMVSIMLLLDPRLKKYAFSDESEYAFACSKLKREVCDDVIEPESEFIEPDPESLWYSFDQEVMKLNRVKDPIGKGILELENYLQEQLLGRDQNPFVWWDQRKAIYPRLFKLMKKYLCVSAKNTQRESITFKTAYMLSQLSKSDCPALESELMFLHHNM